jgi:ribosomal protein S18 acetylase RimI-like enzyme
VDNSKLIYKIKTATANDVSTHLNNCGNDFIPPLNDRVNIEEYSKKIAANAITFEAWDENKLVGLIAAYFNDSKNQTSYITSVSVLKEYMGLGIASILLTECIEYAKQKKYQEIKLEVNNSNNPAISFYKKFNFMHVSNKDDSIIMQLNLK